jgi:hypothetical protein
MKRIGYTFLSCCAMLAFAATAYAVAPAVNSAVIHERVYNDCPVSTVVSTNNYPALIQIADNDPFGCSGFTNFHTWRLSTDGSTDAQFPNNANWRVCTDFSMTGATEGEGGLQFAPWWAQCCDGLFNVKTTGEVAVFGGRLPFYSFTAAHGVNYVKGTVIRLEIVYRSNGLSASAPGTVEYIVGYNSLLYTSGPLAFDQGNAAEDPPHGQWGSLNDSAVGGQFKMLINDGGPSHQLTAAWQNTCFSDDQATPTTSKSWGQVKSIYR